MTIGPGDTISVAADTLNLPLPKAEYSIGSIIPLVAHPDEMTIREDHAGVLTADYISRLRRIDGEPRPRETVNSDMSFIVLSLSLLLITLMTVFGRRSIFSGLSSISFRRREETVPAGTSEVFSWPPILRNIFTVLNAGLFTSTALLVPGLADSDLLGGSTGLTAVLAGSFLAALLLRHLTSMILASITGLKNLFREYMTVVYNIWFAFSAVLFVLNGIILFAPLKNPLPFITAGLIVVAIFLLIRVLKLLSIFHDRHITIFYFLLYLCALEVLPVLVTLKILGVF
ncbi:MAG: DUF4271 domain-containing protein [Bacteroidota bacterium]|nr:DUF4271 domain-containing protein [Bacteroidota bacterium]